MALYLYTATFLHGTDRDSFTFCINPPTGQKITREDIGRYMYMKISVCTLDNMRTLTCAG